jgi:signal transduction histidine kinase/ligand-binding sensor domain-containing protein/DNA-binding response OmpR family regulator
MLLKHIKEMKIKKRELFLEAGEHDKISGVPTILSDSVRFGEYVSSGLYYDRDFKMIFFTNTHMISPFGNIIPRLSIWIIMCLIASYTMGFGNGKRYNFKHLKVEQGLSDGFVECIMQDNKGFIWVGTRDGLNKYDGYEFKAFRHDPASPISLPNNYITCLYQDHDDNIWVGTNGGGVFLYMYHEDRFTQHLEGLDINESIGGKSIWKILRDKEGIVWIATQGGFYRYDPKNKQTRLFIPNPSIPRSISDYAVKDFQIDSHNNIWIATESEGLNMYDPRTREFHHYRSIPGNSETISSNELTTLFIDNSNQLWIGTSSKGISCIDLNTQKITNIELVSDINRIIKKYSVSSLVVDDADNLWISTLNNGLIVYNIQNRTYQHYKRGDAHGGLSSNSVSQIMFDRNDIVWLGYMSAGISFAAIDQANFTVYRNIPYFDNSISHNKVQCVLEDPDGNLWIGTDGGGLNYFNRKNNSFRSYRYDPSGKGLSSDHINFLSFDNRGRLWIATFGGGLNMLDTKTGKFQHFVNNPDDETSISSNHLNYLVYDEETDKIWISSLWGGINQLDLKTGKFIRNPYHIENHPRFPLGLIKTGPGEFWVLSYQGVLHIKDNVSRRFLHDEQDVSSLSSNHVNELFKDSRGNLWAGTFSGLNLYDPSVGNFIRYYEKIGMPNNMIYSIQEDNNGKLWMGTNRGLICIDPVEARVDRVFDYLDGLQGNQFVKGASTKTTDGLLVFGGVEGFIIFDPMAISTNNVAPKVVLTGFQVFNRPQHPSDPESPLRENINYAKEIVLRHKHRVFSLEFAALSFFVPEKNQYAYKLDGFDKEWNNIGNRRMATYTNLRAGVYLFKVKASNNDGVWGEETDMIRIKVLPPIWDTVYARIAYLMILIGIIYMYRNFIRSKERIRSRMKMEMYKAKRSHELDVLKLNFFTNVSHEFKTPLALISAPVENLLKTETDEKKKTSLLLVKRNADRLNRLITQIMDLRRIDSGTHRNTYSYEDVIKYLRDITSSFEDVALHKNLKIDFDAPQLTLFACFQFDNLEKIFYNLLSNAVKYTEPRGKIMVFIDKLEQNNPLNPVKEFETLVIRISDTGIGIEEKEIPNIFKMFYQVQHSGVVKHEGAGIGLALTKELVELQDGKIIVESKPGKGSVFTVYLPIKPEPIHVKNHEKTIIPSVAEDESGDELIGGLPILLVIEDNLDMRSFLSDVFSESMQVHVAIDGIDGWKKAIEIIPDFIICDVMMPKRDGMELTRMLKNDPRTSHIPLILLTARSSDVFKLEGIESGADDFISKPFNVEILKSKVNKLIDSRNQLRERYAKTLMLEPTQIEITSVDEKFLMKAMASVEKNISNCEFTVAAFSDEMGISRIHLYRKLHALTGLAPNEFIRSFRLKRAAQLLKESQRNISEVCYDVGYNDPAYFSKSFKEFHGVLPSEFAQANAPGKK